MKLKIEIEMDNATFEVQNILNGIINKLYNTDLTRKGKTNLRDSNGNTVGFAEVSDD